MVRNSDERSLIRELRNGSYEPVEEVWRLMRSTTGKITKNYHKAEDAAQEAFIKFWKKFNESPECGGYDSSKGSEETWIRQIAANAAKDILRKEKRARKFNNQSSIYNGEGEEIEVFCILPDERSVDPLEHQLESELREIRKERVNQAVECLPPSQREVIKKAYFSNSSYEKGAEELGLKEGTFKSRSYHAKANLRTMMDREHLGV